MKSIAMVPLAALAMIVVSLSLNWAGPRLEAPFGWAGWADFDVKLDVRIEVTFGLSV